MAADILSVVAGATGTQTLGRIVVATGGRINQSNFRNFIDQTPDHDIDIATITEKYDARFDEPRYYTGDAIT